MERALRERLPAGRFVEVAAEGSQMMAAVRGTGIRTTERRLRAALVRGGVTGWTLRPKQTVARPDFFFARERVAVFVDGCFWHGCASCAHTPRTNTAFWAAKIAGNRRARWGHDSEADRKRCLCSAVLGARAAGRPCAVCGLDQAGVAGHAERGASV
jgi:DNA mismatch endonuclease Vsr